MSIYWVLIRPSYVFIAERIPMYWYMNNEYLINRNITPIIGVQSSSSEIPIWWRCFQWSVQDVKRWISNRINKKVLDIYIVPYYHILSSFYILTEFHEKRCRLELFSRLRNKCEHLLLYCSNWCHIIERNILSLHLLIYNTLAIAVY